MKASLEIRTQGTTGNAWTGLKQQGAVVLRIDYDGTSDSRILIDSFVGAGDTYTRRERSLLNITDADGKPVFSGSMEDLIKKLKPQEQPSAFSFVPVDMQEHAQEQMNGIELTDEEAIQCIHLLNKRGDLSVGVSWDTVEMVIGEFIESTELGAAIYKQGFEVPVELIKEESKDRDSNPVWEVSVCVNESILETVSFYDEAEADRQMNNCESYFPNVEIN